MSKLRIRNGPYSGREKTLENDAVTIGRDVEAGVQILDRSASRFHCEVFPVGGMWFVRDLESKNGTYVNGELLEDEELIREGDVIKIGTVELVFETGVAVTDEDSGDRINWSDDASLLSNTLEFRIDDLSDIEDEGEGTKRAGDDARTLQMLYQLGKMMGGALDSDLPAKVCDYLVSTMPAESALIFLREKAGGKLVPHTVRTATNTANPVITRTLIRRTMMENRALLTANAQEDERFDRRESAVLKGIGSVICVPLGISGQTRGVLYLGRSSIEDPFSQRDLEMVSAAAVQLGLAFQNLDHHRRHRRTLWGALLAMVTMLEEHAGCLGSGERCAYAATAVGRSLGLPAASLERLRFAGLLSHIGPLCRGSCTTGSDDMQFLDHLTRIEDFEDIAPLIAYAHRQRTAERSETDGDADVEQKVVAAVAMFEEHRRAQPEADGAQLIKGLERAVGLDQEVVSRLLACHLDGSLYQSRG